MKAIVTSLFLVVLLWIVFPAQAQQVTTGLQATAELKNSDGRIIGNATFTQQPSGVRVLVHVGNLTAGEHGIHIHAVGICDPPDFRTAGAHFNPEGKKHGLQNPNGTHAGDLPNLEVAGNGTGNLDVISPRVTLGPNATNSLFKPNGTALVIHANPDDQVTDPAGNSGPRIACGVILATWQTISTLESIIAERNSQLKSLQGSLNELSSQLSDSNQQLSNVKIIAAVAAGFALLFLIVAAISRPRVSGTPPQ